MAEFEINTKDLGQISAKIVDYKNGLKELDQVCAIRIHDQKLYSLIMADYMPTMGKINGDIVFVKNDGEVSYNKIEGFYKHHHNEFTLIIEKYKE